LFATTLFGPSLRSFLLQPVGHPVERSHVGGVARPHLAAHRDAIAVDDHPQHHLLALVAVVLALAVPAQRVAAGAGEEQRGSVEEHQVEGAEQIAASGEQFLFDEVLGASGRGGVGLGFTERLAEPAHRAVQMLELEPRGAVDGLVTAPLKRAAVGAGDHEPMQHRHEHRAFDIEVMVAGSELLAQHLPAAGLTPQALEDERRAGRADLGVGAMVSLTRGFREHQDALGETSRGVQELVDGAAVGEGIEPAEGCDDGLLDALAFAAIVRDLEISIGADFLDAEEHAASPSLTPHSLGNLSLIFQREVGYFSKYRAEIYHYIPECNGSDQLLSS